MVIPMQKIKDVGSVIPVVLVKESCNLIRHEAQLGTLKQKW